MHVFIFPRQWHNSNTMTVLDYQLAFDVKDFFRLSKEDAVEIYDQVLDSVKQWQDVAKRLGISRSEQIMQQAAFNI